MIEIKESVSLAPFTVYKIGGPARYFADARGPEDFRDALRFGRDTRVPFFILGAGSNILVSDEGFPGIVIRALNDKIEIAGEGLTAGAGARMAQVVAAASRAELTGFEWGIGIPGTIGGSVRGNAGCFGAEMKDVIAEVLILDTASPDFSLRTLSRNECAFGYRDSIFKTHSEWIILSIRLNLAKGDPKKIQDSVLVITRERTGKQDIGTQSCGCIFKNVSWEKLGMEKADFLKKFPEAHKVAGEKNLPAAFLIDILGLKREEAGGITISEKHANFFVNKGGGRARDVRELVRRVQKRVQERYGIFLEEEIQYVGFPEN